MGHDIDFANASVLGAAVAGAMAGGLHAVTGPDHLAALLPICMGHRWWRSCWVGSQWGLGHGLGASGIGAVAFMVKDHMHGVMAFSDKMEIAVGVTLIIIGLFGWQQAAAWERSLLKKGDEGYSEDHDIEMDNLPKAHSHSHSHGHSHGHGHAMTGGVSGVTIVITGIFHGLSGSGHLLGVMPALTLPSWHTAGAYLVAFCLGTMVAMSGFTAMVGELSVRMGETLKAPALPAKLSYMTSTFAIFMGCLWIAKSTVL